MGATKTTVPGSMKRGPQGIIEGRKEKRQKIDRKASLLCTAILKSLTSHTYGWPFNKPVDPVALNIPDYFTLISQPMDLGTIKSKLDKNIYFSIEEFAADVRLTFSNAMTYNPPMNHVHLMATELKNLFERKWKNLEKKCKCENEHGKSMSGGAVRGNVRKFCNRNHPLQKDTLLEEIQNISSLDGRHAKVDQVPKSLQIPCKLVQKDLHKEWMTPVNDVQISPEKAMRVAMLKRRFADTICKAQNKTLFDQGHKSDPVKMKMQKERERTQHEGKARVEEAQIKAVKVAARMKAKEELKQRREREREAERVKIQKIARTVEIQNDLKILEELEMLSGCKLSYGDLSSKHCSRLAMDKSHAQNPLHRLGLFFKDDFITSDEDL